MNAIKEPQKEKYDPAPRTQMPRLEPQTRLKSFGEVEKGLTEAMAVQEGKRCITCGSCCVQACPYDIMQFNRELTKATKCDLCVEKRGRSEIPACFAICPTRCISWSDPKEFPAENSRVL